MKFYIIAGEASGDLHGSNLVKELRKRDASAVIRCWGGDLMQEAGGLLVKHYRDLAFMGFWEVAKNFRIILENLRFCKKDIDAFRPDALILIDYPGFNLRIAEWAKSQGYKVLYYISPQVWAWKENRVKKMKEYIDKMMVILPFEKDYYRTKWDWEVEYVGHPLVEVIENFKKENMGQFPVDKPIVALLPGSRKQEITKKLPVMLRVAKHFPGYQFIVAKAPGQEDQFYKDIMEGYENVSISGQAYSILTKSKAALVTSGTATLETALFGVPQVVCYKGSSISYQIARRVIKVKYIALVNLIMNKPVVKELIQDELNEKNLERELKEILMDEKKIRTIKEDYQNLRMLLSKDGNASANAAESIMRFLS